MLRYNKAGHKIASSNYNIFVGSQNVDRVREVKIIKRVAKKIIFLTISFWDEIQIQIQI